MRDLFSKEDPSRSPTSSGRRIYTVSEITREIKLTLEQSFTELWVEGEISNLKRHSSGHMYFSLKDKESQISCVMWRGRNLTLIFEPRDGMSVLVLGRLSLYERQGRYQLDVSRLQPAGVGALQLAFEALKRRLDEEGLFNPEHKKPLPSFPSRIGIVTSDTGAALRDIVSIIHRRFPSVQLILAPVRVQGEAAAAEIAEAIDDFNAYGDVDVLIVGRGGGSLEDLWVFNEETVARAVFRSGIPVISAVGHEIDFSICDFVADLRAPTPSAAAELVVRDRRELLQALQQRRERMGNALLASITRYRERIDSLQRSYAFRWPADRIREYHLRLDEAARRLEAGLSGRISGSRSDLSRIKAHLSALGPDNVMRRGYSITTRIRDGQIVTRASDVKKEEKIGIRLYEGSLRGVVEDIEDA